jgi:PII-like signaling protein
VKVVRHEAVLAEVPSEAPKRSILQRQEELPIVIVVIDGLAAIPSGCHVIDAAGDL